MATEHEHDALSPEALAEGRRLMTLTEKDGGGAYYDGDFRYDPADDLEEWLWVNRAALLAAAEREATMRKALEDAHRRLERCDIGIYPTTVYALDHPAGTYENCDFCCAINPALALAPVAEGEGGGR